MLFEFLKQIKPIYANLLAVIGCVLDTHKISIRPAIKISVLSTDVSISSKARFALTTVHRVWEMAQVVAASVLIAVVASIEAGITRCAHLQEKMNQSAHISSWAHATFIIRNLSVFSHLPVSWKQRPPLLDQMAVGRCSVRGKAGSCNLALCSHTCGLR